jgi:hypothetical protein
VTSTTDTIWDKARYWHTVGAMLHDLGVPAERGRTLRASIESMPEATQALFYHAAPVDVVRDLTGVDTWTPEMVERSRQIWRAAPTNQEMAESMARLRAVASIDIPLFATTRRGTRRAFRTLDVWRAASLVVVFTALSGISMYALRADSLAERFLLGSNIAVVVAWLAVQFARYRELGWTVEGERSRRGALLDRRDD